MSETELPTTVEWTGAPTVCTAILEAVADAKGVDPTDLETQLYEVIDPDAVERLFGNEREKNYRLTFRFDGCSVVVQGDGFVLVYPYEAPSASFPGSPGQKKGRGDDD